MGIACADGEVTTWNSALSPTIRNVIKGVLISKVRRAPLLRLPRNSNQRK
jgi:hypothetical protein